MRQARLAGRKQSEHTLSWLHAHLSCGHGLSLTIRMLVTLGALCPEKSQVPRHLSRPS